MSNKWMERYFDLAVHISSWSKDTTKVGAVIVGKDKRNIAFGYNGFPPGVDDSPSRLAHKELKYRFTSHAEANAVVNANFDCTGATLIATKSPCSECMKLIISKRIAKVVSPSAEGEKWIKDAAFSKIMASEAGVIWEEIK